MYARNREVDAADIRKRSVEERGILRADFPPCPIYTLQLSKFLAIEPKIQHTLNLKVTKESTYPRRQTWVRYPDSREETHYCS